jgi:hypothetical protein
MQYIGFIILLIFVTYIIYDYNVNLKYKYGKIYVISSVDNKPYLVNDTNDKQNIADTLGTLNLKLILLKKELNKINLKSEQLQTFLKNIDKMTINESNVEEYSTFVINKTDVYFCLKNPNNEIYDTNILTYVLLHELSHIYSYSEGHTSEFIENFKFLLNVSKRIGIYSEIDFETNNKMYCGVNVKNNIN